MTPLQPPHQNQISMQPYAPTALEASRVHCRMRNAGFTLVELLVVIAVIAVLAALAFPTLSKMSTQSSLSKAVSNFRGLGAAIALYAAENDQSLPRLQKTHRCAYRNSSPNQIGSVLYLQMGLPAPTKDYQPVPLLRVPALMKWLSKYRGGDSNQSAHLAIQEITMPDGSKRWPFGGGTSLPLKFHQVPNPSKIWAVYEMGGAGDPDPVLDVKSFPEPIHGSKRTVLFFDGHVEAIPSASPAPTF